MRSAASLRAVTLLVIALALVAGVLGVQLANGGGDFVPARAADPCVARKVTTVSKGVNALSERLVLIGLDGAACRLKVTREALVLELAQPGRRTDAQVDAVRAGLLDAVDRMDREGTLPKASALADEAVDNSNLNRFVKYAIKALPDSLVDGALKTDDVLRRAINGLDLRTLLTNLDNPADLTAQINAAVTDAVKASLVGRLRGLI